MVLKNSYIFLEHSSKKTSSHRDEQGNIVFDVGHNVHGFIKSAFPNSIKDISIIDVFKTKLDCFLEEDKNVCDVSFVISTVEKITYLDVIVSGKGRSKLISCLEFIQEKLFSSGVRQYYIEIVSYDSISEFYCNKTYVKLNALERNLRKLLFNIYILHFGKDYYSATMNIDLQKKIKGVIGSNNNREYQKRIKELYNVNADNAEAIIRLQQFFYSLEFGDIQKFLFTPSWTSVDKEERQKFLTENKDLSELSDKELRKAFKEFTPKSDWERFFSCKINILEIEKTIDEIRRYRNAVAHLKFFYKDDYLKSNELILELNKAILKAIKLTEEKDFAEKNAMNLCKTFSGISKMLTAMYSTIREVTLSFVQSEAFQIVKSIASIVEESSLVKGLGKLAIQAAQNLEEVENDESTQEDDNEENVDEDDENDIDHKDDEDE